MTVPDRTGWLTGALAIAPSCPPFPDFTPFEEATLNALGPAFGDDESAFRAQVSAARVTDCVNTGVGFYTRVSVDRVSCGPIRYKQQRVDVSEQVTGEGVIIILWDDDGYLATIEGCSYGDNPFDGMPLSALKFGETLPPPRVSLFLDASEWRDISDFYRAVFQAIEAPEWHSQSPDALNDSMVFGKINGRQPPYDLVIGNLHVPQIMDHVEVVGMTLARGRAEFRSQHGRDVDVSIRLTGQPSVR